MSESRRVPKTEYAYVKETFAYKFDNKYYYMIINVIYWSIICSNFDFVHINMCAGGFEINDDEYYV